MRICLLQDAIEFPYLGIAGIVRFIDVRTQWFDEGVNTALDDGITQVRLWCARPALPARLQ
jgi:O-methyltransferase involved in polyketide biosynthesis